MRATRLPFTSNRNIADFDELFFVVANRGSDPRSRISDELCNYKNVMCIEYEEMRYGNVDELRAMVHILTMKFRRRFEYFFGASPDWLSPESETNAVERLDATARAAAALKNEPPEKVDLRYGVRGGDVFNVDDSAPALIMPSDRRGLRRRLSIALPGGGCEVTWPQPPKNRIQTSYAASYPGCGARMTWNLIEALTGLWTGDDWDNNKRGHRVVTVKTHYPHDAGKLVSWDDRINRALVIIRNPMNAIPSFFNHIYEIKNNLAIHSQRAPVGDWIEWRDRLAMSQVNKFAEFVDYWMERFDKSNHDRILISYETLTDDNDGPEEAIRISNFLSQSEGVDPIDIDLVPCIWRSVVKYKEQPKVILEKTLDNGRRRLDPLHHDSQRAGPTERPYTAELLNAMSEMLSNLIKKWGNRHMRLRTVLEGYQQDVHAAYLALNKQSPLPRPEKKYHVYQISVADSGSTVLNNLLVGLIDPDAAFKNSSVITKTHDTNLLELYKKERPKFDEVFFVVSNEGINPQTRIDKEICTYDNVLCIEYEELMYNNIEELHDMVNNMANKFQSRFEYFFGPGLLDESHRREAVKRLETIDNAIAALESPSTTDAALAGDSKVSNRFEVNGKSFHIFQVSYPDIERSMDQTLANTAMNWLMGLFEPDGEFSFMINNREQTVRGKDCLRLGFPCFACISNLVVNCIPPPPPTSRYHRQCTT